MKSIPAYIWWETVSTVPGRKVPSSFCAETSAMCSGEATFLQKGPALPPGEKAEERSLKGYLFLGNDLVRHNVGMEMTISGSPAYYPMIQAGVNWYEAEKECELILDGTEDLVFVVSDMESGKKNRYTMHLPAIAQASAENHPPAPEAGI